MMRKKVASPPYWTVLEVVSLRDKYFADIPDDQVITDAQERAFDVWLQSNASPQLKQYMKQRKKEEENA